MNYELKLKDAAEQLNVSVTSLHNWIKEGILKTVNNSLTQECLDDFKRNYLNKDKLSSRANKQYKDIHNHSQLTEDITLRINSGLSGEEISDGYESSLSESYKNKEGIYYTPQYIVEDMMRDIVDVENKTFLDPCCGSGNFIIEAIKKGFAPENIYGFDTDANAVAITKKRIKELCGYESDNIFCEDFLSQQPTANSQQPTANISCEIYNVKKHLRSQESFYDNPKHILNFHIDEKESGQVADIDFYKAKEKVIYRFISDRIVCYHDTEQRYILNSANLFVLNDDFPLTHKQVADLLNSDIMNWLFRSIFSTHKILRSDLELLPIWHEYFERYEDFSEESLKEYLGIVDS